MKIYISCKKHIVFLSMCILLRSMLYAGSSAGSTSAEFLLMSNGARPSAMGDAFAGVADDVHAISYNPAGLGSLQSSELALMHSKWLLDTTYEYAAYAQPLRKGTLGVSLAYLDSGDMVGRSNMGQKTHDFTATDLAVTLGYGIKIAQEMFVGLNGKFITQKIDDASRNGGAIDIGVLWELLTDKLYAGITIQNMGPKLQAFDSTEDTLPMHYRMGVGYYALERKLLIASDVKTIVHGKPTISVGIEYLIRTLFFLRSGILAGSDVDNSLAWTGGVGFTVHKFYFDYCYEPFGELDSTHKISLVIKFKGYDF
ncbi:MAG: PorV/PorQ family protein [bacterium]